MGRFGTTESHTTFDDPYDDYEERNIGGTGWGSPDGKGGFGPQGAAAQKKQKRVKKARKERVKRERKARKAEEVQKDKQALFKLFLALASLIVVAIGASALLGPDLSDPSMDTDRNISETVSDSKKYAIRDVNKEVKQEFLTENEYSRPTTSLKKVNGIVIHYVANPGSSAMDNRNYFENLKKTHERKASAHFIIGIDGEIIQCIPLDEVAYCSNARNYDTISIECCHKTADGEFTDETYTSLVRLCKYLMKKYKLKTKDVIRHYDVTGKLCPLYFVDHPENWAAFLEKLK